MSNLEIVPRGKGAGMRTLPLTTFTIRGERVELLGLASVLYWALADLRSIADMSTATANRNDQDEEMRKAQLRRGPQSLATRQRLASAGWPGTSCAPAAQLVRLAMPEQQDALNGP